MPLKPMHAPPNDGISPGNRGAGAAEGGKTAAGRPGQLDRSRQEHAQALLFNRRLWSIFMSAAETNDNPQPMEIRQNIANIGVFVMKQTIEMQMNPDPAKLKSLIDINCNIAAGLSGRA